MADFEIKLLRTSAIFVKIPDVSQKSLTDTD